MTLDARREEIYKPKPNEVPAPHERKDRHLWVFDCHDQAIKRPAERTTLRGWSRVG